MLVSALLVSAVGARFLGGGHREMIHDKLGDIEVALYDHGATDTLRHTLRALRINLGAVETKD